MKSRFETRGLWVLLLAIVVFGGITGCKSAHHDDTLTVDQVLEAAQILHAYHIKSPEIGDLMTVAWAGAAIRARDAGVDVGETALGLVSFAGWPLESIDGSFRELFSILVEGSKGRVSEQVLLEHALFSMAELTQDGHTSYIPASRWKRTQDGQEIKQWTPFFLYRAARVEKGALIWDVEPGSQAERGGLKVGDTVVELNGPVEKSDYPLLREVNTFTVERPKAGRLHLKVKLEPESMHPFETRMIGDIAYFELYVFPPLDWHSGNDRFRDNVTRELRSMADQHPAGWILDLRNNGGGSVDTLTSVAAAFGVHGPVYLERQKGYLPREIASGEWGTLGDVRGDAPMVVLTNGATASSGELLSFALQEHHIAYLLGRKTRGSVQGAMRVPLSRGGGFSIAASESKVGVQTGFTTVIEGVGVSPDEELSLDLEGILRGVDNQLQRALDYLHGNVSRP